MTEECDVGLILGEPGGVPASRSWTGLTATTLSFFTVCPPNQWQAAVTVLLLMASICARHP